MDIHEAIRILRLDGDQHNGIIPPLSGEQIAEFERSVGFKVPPSFATFLKEFGSGSYGLYGCQPIDSVIDSITNPPWLKAYRPNLPDSTEIDEGRSVPTDSLLCLMTEDSNGGAWCWLLTLRTPDGECPLAYWDMSGTLFYKVDSFAEWLETLVTSKNEVIRALDIKGRLPLG